MNKIKPCPFCGAKPSVEKWKEGYEEGITIKCPNCCEAIVIESNAECDSWEETAIKIWNSVDEDVLL